MFSLDVATLIAVIASPLVILGVMIALFLWLRSESSADRRHYQQEASADRRDLLQLIREIKEELKDYHGRLCSLEERNKKSN